MTVHAHISLTKTVDDLDKADDWYEEVKNLLAGKTDCVMNAQASNREDRVIIEKEG